MDRRLPSPKGENSFSTKPMAILLWFIITFQEGWRWNIVEKCRTVFRWCAYPAVTMFLILSGFFCCCCSMVAWSKFSSLNDLLAGRWICSSTFMAPSGLRQDNQQWGANCRQLQCLLFLKLPTSIGKVGGSSSGQPQWEKDWGTGNTGVAALTACLCCYFIQQTAALFRGQVVWFCYWGNRVPDC